MEAALIDVIAKAEPCVVAISRQPAGDAARPPQNAALLEAEPIFGELRPRRAPPQPPVVAAGILVGAAGVVLTEYLAVREGDEHTIALPDGRIFPAEIRGADPRSGLAVLTIGAPAQGASEGESPPAVFNAIRFGDAGSLRKGQFVVAIGNPYAIRADGEATASWGIVTNLARKAPAGTDFNGAPGPADDYRTTLHHLGTLIQTDARLGWSAGGGALVNLHGELVGVTSTVSEIAGHEQPAGYAIPMNTTLRRIVETLIDGREVEYGLLGVSLSPASDAGGEHVVVQHAYAGSPGDRAGLRQGDVIVRVDGKTVDDVDELQLAVSSLPPLSVTTIEYERDQQRKTTQVTLAKLGVAGKKVITNQPAGWRGLRVDFATALDAVQLAEAIESNALDPEGCVLVAEVEPGSPAAAAGVKPGMFISHVGSQRVSTPGEFYDAIKGVGDGFDIKLTQPSE
jgi:S1-C subfamily serine protease